MNLEKELEKAFELFVTRYKDAPEIHVNPTAYQHLTREVAEKMWKSGQSPQLPPGAITTLEWYGMPVRQDLPEDAQGRLIIVLQHPAHWMYRETFIYEEEVAHDC